MAEHASPQQTVEVPAREPPAPTTAETTRVRRSVVSQHQGAGGDSGSGDAGAGDAGDAGDAPDVARIMRRLTTGHDHHDGPCGPGCVSHATAIVRRHAIGGRPHQHHGPCGPACWTGSSARVQRHAAPHHHHHDGPCGPGCPTGAAAHVRRHADGGAHEHDDAQPAAPRTSGALVVGAADDRYEREAETVASRVLRAWGQLADVRRHLDGQPVTAAPAAVVSRIQRHTHAPAQIGAEGGSVDRQLESRIQMARGRGAPLPDTARAPMEHAFGADLSRVRLHTGSEAADLNRRISADAFTIGNDIFFRDGVPDVGNASGRHLLAHELTHTLQQDGGAHRFHGAIGTISRSTSYVIHRHAAYEHYLLGQLQPRELASIPAVRKAKDNPEQNERIEQGKGSGLDASATDTTVDQAMRDEVKHLITQEMSRLLAFRKNPEALESQRDQMGQVGREQAQEGDKPVYDGAEHPKWKVPIVVLPCRDGESIVVTYSELNTLPDLFGNPEAISQTPKSKVLALLQGVRQQLYIELDNLQKEIFGVSTNKLHNRVLLDDDFEGAQGPRAQAVVEGIYEKHKESEVNSATTREGEEDEQYFAALERNACHFAPESWTQWRGYHDRAIALAQAAAQDRANGDTVGANKKANEALLLNGFGEHYLQDSFASGHLIDKTKIMRWFTQWIDANGGHGSFEKGKGEWAMKAYAAKQDLQSNPQRLHDKAKRGQVTTAQQGATEIGMGDNPATKLFIQWRNAAIATPALKHITPNKVAEMFGYGVNNATGLLDQLVTLDFAKKVGKGRNEKYSIHQVHLKSAQDRETGAFESNLALDPQGPHSTDAQVAEFDLEAYNLLMSDAHIQGSTKFFHDMFCKEGLEVKSGEGTAIGRIYGDSNMMNAGGQTGLEYAAETSRQSRSAVFHAIKGWNIPYTTAEIEARFPTQVKVDDAYVSLVDWNAGLKAKGDNGLFKKASTFGARLVEKTSILGEKSGISKKGALNLSAIQEIGQAKARLDQQRLDELLQALAAMTGHDGLAF